METHPPPTRRRDVQLTLPQAARLIGLHRNVLLGWLDETPPRIPYTTIKHTGATLPGRGSDHRSRLIWVSDINTYTDTHWCNHQHNGHICSLNTGHTGNHRDTRTKRPESNTWPQEDPTP